MWRDLPQIKCACQSATYEQYAISSTAEATEYLNHSELGNRLRDCTQLVAAINGSSIEDIFGYPDYLKFHSSMTLFARATNDNQVFMDALRKYYRSEFDRQTIERL